MRHGRRSTARGSERDVRSPRSSSTERVPGFDRDLVDEATSCGCAVIVVNDGRSRRDWLALGATAVLANDFDRNELLDVLEANTVRIGIGPDEQVTAMDADVPARSAAGEGISSPSRGRAAPGASVIAMALAQGLAADARLGGLVALADLALDADQAMLHDAGDVVPGIQELVEIHRNAAPSAIDVRSLAYSVTDRNYDLLLGLRRHRDWVTIRPRSFDAALDGLRRAYKAVVADVSNDVEGERQCGSIDVEERNLMARSTTAAADAVVVVGTSGPRGIHRLVRLIAALVEHGVDGERILPVVNRSAARPAQLAQRSRPR